MEAATAMDFHTLSRRELQALCKSNGIRANMTNVAMAEALQGLTSVDGIDEIGRTLCLPTPGRSAAKMVAVVEEQQHGSPLPRGRRVSVKSPEAIRMEVEGGEGEVKEIVKTPGVALRSTRRGARATPAPLPTPAPAGSTRATARRTAARKTVEVLPTPATRRSQRMASRKAAGALEADRSAEDVPEEKASKMAIALDQEAEVVAAALKEEKVEDEPKAAVSDVKFDDSKEEMVQDDEPKAAVSEVKFDDSKEEKGQKEEPNAVASEVNDDPEEEVAKFSKGENKEELEEGEEADSSDATTGSAAVLIESCNDPMVEEVVVILEEQSTTPLHEGIVKEKEPTSVDSPILGVIEKEQDASVEDCEDLAEFSPAREMTDEINPAEDKEVAISEEALTEDKVVAINVEAVEEDSFANTVETDPTPKEILLTAAGEDEAIQEGVDDEMPQAGEISEKDEELADNETSDEDEDDLSEEDEDDLSEETEGADAKMLQGELMDNGTSEEYLDEDEEWVSDDDENNEEIGSTDESDEEIGSTDESGEDTDETIGAVQMLQGTEMAEEANKDTFCEDDDFSGDLPPECDNMMIFSDAETESDSLSPVLEVNQAAVASATKSAKSQDDSATEQEGPEEADATEEVDNIVKSLDEFTFKEGESEEMQKQQLQDYNSLSLRKLKSTYRKLIVAKHEGKQEEVTEGKRLPLEEVDENACISH